MGSTVDVFWACPIKTAALEGLLCREEVTRLEGMLGEADRRRFVCGRALLRIVAGARLGVRPAEVEVDAACAECDKQHGRPVVRTAPGVPVLHVSVAHADDRVLVAVTSSGPVGVDVEARTASAFAGFDDVALTHREKVLIASTTPDRRDDLRTAMWVKKEAALKLGGHGLRQPPDTVESDDPLLLFTELRVGPDYHAYLATASELAVTVELIDASRLLAAQEG